MTNVGVAKLFGDVMKDLNSSEDDKLLAELEAGLQIDEDALNEDAVGHSDAFYQVAKTLALRRSQRDAAKQLLAEVEARVDARVRHDAAVDNEKITNPEVESLKLLDKEVQRAKSQLAYLNKMVGLFEALKESFVQRSYNLTHMVDLYVSGYFGDAAHRSTENSLKQVAAQKVRRDIRENIRERRK